MKHKKRMPYREIRKLRAEVKELRELREYKHLAIDIFRSMGDTLMKNESFNRAFWMKRFTDVFK